MSFVHEQSGWPNLTWDDSRLAALLAEVRHRQGRLLGRMAGLGLSLRAEATLTSLTSEIVKSSAIEGESLDSEEVRSSVARRLGIDYGSTKPPGQEVEGTVEMMLDATQRFAEPLTAERLCAWHASLFPAGRSGINQIIVGAWRPASVGAMQVVSGPAGNERVHFEAPAAERLNFEMGRFMEWFAASDGTDPVLKAGVAHFRFVTIHPFQDGNGRIGRAIMDMALARAEGLAERYYSMSSQIEAERAAYYLRLERCQRGHGDITDWLVWFLECLGRAFTGADEALANVLRKARVWERITRVAVNERQRKVIDRLLEDFRGKLTSTKYAKLAKCSPDTALRDIKSLLERGFLIQEEGGGRSTSYRLAEPKPVGP